MRKIAFQLALFCLCLFSCAEAVAASSQEKLERYLSELIEQKTVTSDKEANRRALRWVEEQLAPLPLQIERVESNGFHSLLITTRKTKNPKVWLAAHMDVVSAEEEAFHLKREGGRLYGRGAYDMKMAIACYILLMHELKDELGSYDLGIMLTTDEEVGGFNGTKQLLEQDYSGDLVLLPDGGFDWKIEKEAKGVLQLGLKAEGLSAHGSRPWKGDNAIYKLIAALQEIQSYFEKEKERYGDYYPTLNLGTIQGGGSVNQVPDRAEAKLDIRFPPSADPEELLASVAEIVGNYPGLSVEKLIEAPPHRQDLERAPFERFRRIAEELYGIEVGSMSAHGASDARFFFEKEIPVLVVSPRGGDIHSADEWIDREDLARFYEVVKAWVAGEAREASL